MKDDRNDTERQNSNGVVTVNNDANPTVQQRDEIIGQEPDTARLRSEKESVEDAGGNTTANN